MKLKELKKSVTTCWSPEDQYPVMLAAGTAAQHIDATFDSASSLDIYSLNFRVPGYDLELKASIPTKNKFHKLVWSSAGVIVTGSEAGTLQLWGVDRLLKSEEALLTTCNEHTGPVTALDVNPYQRNLVASGAGESGILIWDLMGPARPMAPGAKPQPAETVQALAWNTQVQHILGSTFNSRCIVWDLRKNEPIMKLSDPESRAQWGSLSWHPKVATQLVIASKDDNNPVIQLWDLRLASSPLCSLSCHRRGVLSLSWSSHDSSLLLSAARDQRVLINNPDNNVAKESQFLQELCVGVEALSEASWCPRIPGVCSVISQSCQIHSLFGTSKPGYTSQNQSDILESFGSVAELGSLPTVSRNNERTEQIPQLPKPPIFIQRPVRAKFAFGGKLVSFVKPTEVEGSQRLVYISQVVSDPTLIEKVGQLDEIIAASRTPDPAADDVLANICLREGDACSEQSWRYLWFFLRANFMRDFKQEAINLLGFKQDEIPKLKPQSVADENLDAPNGILGLSRGESTETEAELSTDTSTDLSDAHTLIEKKLILNDVSKVSNVVIPSGDDNTSGICRALVTGQIEEAVDLCLESNRVDDALVIASFGNPELLSRVQRYHVSRKPSDPVSVISRALLGRDENTDWPLLVSSVSCSSWTQLLAIILTYTDANNMIRCCQLLGDKLMKDDDVKYHDAAMICYICAGNHSALMDICRKKQRDLTALAQLSLLAQRAADNRTRDSTYTHQQNLQSPVSDRILSQYALMLTSQGYLNTALNLLKNTQSALKTRLTRALHIQQQPTQDNQWKQRPADNYYASPAWQTQVSRPSSVGPQTGGVTSRSKYRVDPSVQSANYNYTTQSNPYPIYNEQQQYMGSIPNNTTNNPGIMNPVQPVVNQPQLNPVGVNGNNYYQPEPPTMKSAAPGWNDPPPLTAKPKPKADAVSSQAPITHPLFGTEPVQYVPLNANLPSDIQYNPPQSGYPPQYNQNSPYPQQYQYSQNPQSQTYQPPQTYQQPQSYQQPAEVAKAVVEKPPIPERYQHIQVYFEQLRDKCLQAATSPHMRKKLEDVQRRLDSLYDVLRDNLLSANGIESISECISLSANGDLEHGLSAIQRLADGADFVYAASFLPGLKVLLQTAITLKSYAYAH